MAGTIRVDTDELITLLQYLKPLRDALDNQRDLIPSLSSQLDAAITGSASNIAAFYAQFKSWADLLGAVTTDMDQAYSALKTVLTDAQNAMHAL